MKKSQSILNNLLTPIKSTLGALIATSIKNPLQVIFAIALTSLYFLPFSSNLNFDVRAEFSLYMLLFSFLLLLFLRLKSNEKLKVAKELRALSYLLVLLTLFNLLSFKTFLLPDIIEIAVVFLMILVFLIMVKEIGHN